MKDFPTWFCLNNIKYICFNVKFIDKQHCTYQSKTVSLQIFLIQVPRPKQSKECSYLACCTYLSLSEIISSFHYAVVSFSITPGDQTDETESPKLVNLTKQNSRWVQSFSFVLLGVLRNFKRRGLLTDLETTRNKRAASWIL